MVILIMPVSFVHLNNSLISLHLMHAVVFGEDDEGDEWIRLFKYLTGISFFMLFVEGNANFYLLFHLLSNLIYLYSHIMHFKCTLLDKGFQKKSLFNISRNYIPWLFWDIVKHFIIKHAIGNLLTTSRRRVETRWPKEIKDKNKNKTHDPFYF